MDTVLVVDDEQAVRDALDRALRLSGYAVTTAQDGLTALRLLDTDRPDAIVLDVAMPGLDGLGVARRIRQDGDRIPILMLTARDAVDDRVAGLDAGADDYLAKPFALEELLARLRALLRRTTREHDAPPTTLTYEDLRLDTDTMLVHRGERRLELTRTEFLLLELFLENPRRVLPRDVLLDRVWGLSSGTSSNALEVYVGYLRRKLEADGEPRMLRTVRGVGYQLLAPT
jgi:two-component system response regulator MprA